MANEQDLERSFSATPRRHERTRERGQPARPRELSTAAIALGGALALSTLERLGSDSLPGRKAVHH